jgi:uncharacterized delta-60 repeat protein
MAAVMVVAAPAESSRRSAPTTDWAYALALQKDGKVVAAGLSRAPGRDAFGLVRYTTKGRLDDRFGRGGRAPTSLVSGQANAVAIQPDGRIVAAGGSWAVHARFPLVRYTRDGRLDPGFGQRGVVLADFGFGKSAAAVVRALAIQRDGKIVTVGATGPVKGPTYFALARYTAGGKLDRGFGRGGEVLTRIGNDRVSSLAIQTDGKIVVAGSARILRYTARGKLDPSFGTGGKVVVTEIGIGGMAIEANGSIVAAGGGQGPSKSYDFGLVRYIANGKLDTSFGDGGTVLTNFGADPTANTEGSSEGASAVAIQPDGKIVAAGSTDVRGVFCGGRHPSNAMRAREYAPERVENLSICDDFALARYNEDGSVDTTFGKDGTVVTDFVARSGARESSSKAEAVVIQTDGKIVVAGLANGYDFGLARYTTRGRLDASFGSGGKVATDFGAG